MALKTFNPTSPGQRQLVIVDRSGLHKGKPVKSLTEGLTKKGGRNNTGRITSRVVAAAAQAHLPHGRFQASRKFGIRRPSSGWNTIRTGPHSLR
jgi:ribosomal protein L2